jgi:hypothetical protein
VLWNLQTTVQLSPISGATQCASIRPTARCRARSPSASTPMPRRS